MKIGKIVRGVVDSLIQRYRPDLPVPVVEITPPEEKERLEREGDQIRRELAYWRTHAMRLAVELRQGEQIRD